MAQKRLLLLGGGENQLPGIKAAKKLGYYTVLCDYLPDNPGQHLVDKWYMDSVLDKDKMLQIAREEKVDGVLSFNSEVVGPVAAYVAEQLGLPGIPFEAVETLRHKDSFRKFLEDNGFPVPRSFTVSADEFDKALRLSKELAFPIMVKPTDSSGSRGVSRIDSLDELERAFNYAAESAKTFKVQCEEFITMDHPYMIGGDVFVYNGRVVFWGLLNCYRDNEINPLVPVGKFYPPFISEKRLELIKNEAQRLTDVAKILMGAFNLEIMVDKDDHVFFIEFAPRNGGNLIPVFLEHLSGVSMVDALVKASVGDSVDNYCFESSSRFMATHNLHTQESGIFDEVLLSSELSKYVVFTDILAQPGDKIEPFIDAGELLGVIFLSFPDRETMCHILENINTLYTVKLRENTE